MSGERVDVGTVMASTDWLDEQEPGYWEGFTELTEVNLWQQFGFAYAEAEAWHEALSAGYDDLEESDFPAIAAAWVVAGVVAEDYSDWLNALAHVDPVERPKVARRWRESGFDAQTAATWADNEELRSAVLLENAGWSRRQRDLLDLLLRDRYSVEARHELLSWPLPPVHVLDYLKAGVPLSQFAYYERLRRDGDDIADRLRELGSKVERSFELSFRIDEVAASLRGDPPGYYSEPVLSGHTNVVDTVHDLVIDLPDGWEDPVLLDWSIYSDYSRTWQPGSELDLLIPEDHACPPNFDWTDLHRSSLEAGLAEHEGDDGMTLEVSWPPDASLWTPGLLNVFDPVGCEVHEDFEPACWDCTVPDPGVEVEPAQWRWTVDVTVYERHEDGDGRSSVDVRREHFLTTDVDPRTVEYSTMGPLV
ncbi:hypothetical protein ACFQW6_07350 [Nocardioides sp. GCM10028917]|uniref:hypothetical protein n=1 Tax=Nocardioides sp. GCM10028917 TaxID=3273408 RepID=UPI00361019C3